MKNNNKIIGSIFVVFLVSIILLGISEQTVGKHTDVDLITKTEFFSQNFTENNTIFLLGSSHVRSLNASTINEVISSDTQNKILSKFKQVEEKIGLKKRKELMNIIKELGIE